MTRKFVIAFCAFTSVSGAAVAGPIEDCNPQSPSPVIVRSCSEIIQGRSFSADQKAIAYKNRAIVHLNAGANDKAIADFTAAIRLKKVTAWPMRAGAGQSSRTRMCLDQLLITTKQSVSPPTMLHCTWSVATSTT